LEGSSFSKEEEEEEEEEEEQEDEEEFSPGSNPSFLGRNRDDRSSTSGVFGVDFLDDLEGDGVVLLSSIPAQVSDSGGKELKNYKHNPPVLKQKRRREPKEVLEILRAQATQKKD
jgi:hypothetical protein